MMHRGDIVYDVADPRHHGMIRCVCVNRKTATIRWLDTGWLSCRVPLRGLRHVHDVTEDQRSMSIYYGGRK